MKDIRQERLSDLADMVAWLPAGCAFWRSVGGPMSLSEGDHLARLIDYRLRLLVWMKTEDAQHKRNQPKPPEQIPYSGESVQEQAHAERQYQARLKREQRSS